MGDFIESCRKIQKDDVHLVFSSAQLSGYSKESCDELGLAVLTFPKSMLVVTEDTIGLKVAHDATVQDMLQTLACDGCLRDWLIVLTPLYTHRHYELFG